MFSTSEVYEALRSAWAVYWAETDPAKRALIEHTILTFTRVLFKTKPR